MIGGISPSNSASIRSIGDDGAVETCRELPLSVNTIEAGEGGVTGLGILAGGCVSESHVSTRSLSTETSAAAGEYGGRICCHGSAVTRVGREVGAGGAAREGCGRV